MFRKTLIATTTVAAIISCSSAFAVVSSTDFGSGTITLHGSVTEAPCTITNGENLDLKLGQIPQNQLAANAATSTPQFVDIHLDSCVFESSTNVTPGAVDPGQKSKVDVEFTGYGTAVDATKGIIPNAASSDAATNVNIQLLRTPSTPFDLSKGAALDTAQQLAAGNGNVVRVYARMIASGKASTGAVSSTLIYKLKYF